MIASEREQAELLDTYRDALAHDPATPPPAGLDAAVAAVARVLVRECAPAPDAAFTTALRRHLVAESEATTTRARRPDPAPFAPDDLPSPAAAARPAPSPMRARPSTRRRPWAAVRAVANGLAVALLVATLVGALVLIMRGPAVGRGGTASSPTHPERPSSCTEALLPQQPATPPNRVIPATPTGREAALYVPCAFEREASLRRADAAGLVQHLAATQTVGGFTLTVQRFYADGNRIVIGYTIAAADWITDDHRLGFGEVTLTDSAGRAYGPNTNVRGGYSGFGGPERLNAAVLSFDGSLLPPDVREETFRLRVGALSITSISGQHRQPPPPTTAIDNDQSTPVGQQGIAQPVPAAAPVGTAGPWDVSITAPVVPARIAEVDQTVAAAVVAHYSQGDPEMPVPPCAACPTAPVEAIPLTLERVRVTPSETRVYLRVAAPTLGPRGGQWEVRGIGIEDPDSKPAQDFQELEGTRRLPDGRQVVSFSNPLYDKPAGEWTLTIGELFTVVPPDPADRSGRGGVIVRLTGQWTYHFTMPEGRWGDHLGERETLCIRQPWWAW